MKRPYSLIIEDDQDVAAVFGAALEAAGFETDVIRSGDEALKRLEAETPSMVLLDLHLPQVDGMQILRWIRENPRLDATRVIVATADPLMASCLGGEADLVLVKPIGFSQLLALSERLI